MKNQFNAILVAAGNSSRMQGIDKIFASINGKAVIEKTIEAFLQTDRIQKIVVVCRQTDQEKLQKRLANKNKPILFAVGGKSRQESVLNGINLVLGSDYFVIHDAARPMVTPNLIESLCEEALIHGAVSAAVWAKDTCKLVDEDGFVTETPQRERLMMVQTPQIFAGNLYLEAVEKAKKANREFTDDCQLIEFNGGKVRLCLGDYRNIKITTPEDLLTANAFCEGERKMRIGYGYDVHQLVENRKLILGGVEIPFEKGLLGHSDADVLAHAVSDAILGAAAMGDIGKLFPDTDDSFEGADSLLLLTEVCHRIREKGYEIGNIDATIMAQRPKLSPHIEKMRKKLAKACQISHEDISVKATTEEGLGFTGREEGMAASAVCLLN
ncbi:2-C-methyl-D-erythritol 2,4-cyclodiphosphate synthase [Scatolibacter rhodanostii]|uniref:2-C-methyl-D-erythritol 2,4-cyclodiphosphate synthase n=1 Tax=Scatolibacter rhodanostii TaxID=2014781 RepID=UPI000C06D190|nr:2-C-methyl-D-erythritol 2,4-cyclodiphosphate synthase [Scatolibacter rhodanostii]